jgi:hypothetical protein
MGECGLPKTVEGNFPSGNIYFLRPQRWNFLLLIICILTITAIEMIYLIYVYHVPRQTQLDQQKWFQAFLSPDSYL